MAIKDLCLAFDSYQKGEIGLEGLLNLLPEEKDRAFEVNLTNWVEKKGFIINEQFNKILEKSDQLDDKIVFAAFYGLCIYYRRMKEFTKLDEIIYKFEVKFESNPMYNHILALSLKSKGGHENIETAITKAKLSADSIEGNSGVFHNYAEVMATAMEEEIIQDSSQIDDAIDYVKKSITLSPKYAKYYCTYGRLLALKNDIPKGLQSIKKAIDLEDSQKNDYAIRIGDYQAYHSRLIFMQYTSRLQKKINVFEQKVNDIKKEASELVQSSLTKNLEFLGFFAALLSFIIASIQIISNQPFEKATQLIIVLSGCLICTFSGFFALIHNKIYFLRIFIAFIIGATMIVSALLLIPKII